ncbi:MULTISPECIES: 2Fe-2S iron-sulfur cluster-binding protein [unclassified Streptomyces]|uniref:2Fe-2S iron-sulfur cluster-binding protein n=1 Tax=unclassified Streptomyces TaxID=2593676 RepID=UPI001905114F|nr:2Fe-2S iron-sulfur cluster-binding protein [Streptomyces sp. HSG2]
MTDDQHAERHPEGDTGRRGGRWDPLPQGEYDDGATAFVQFPEGGVEALLAGSDSPLAAPGHGYTPPPIAASPPADPDTGSGWAPRATPPDGVEGSPTDAPEPYPDRYQDPYGAAGRRPPHDPWGLAEQEPPDRGHGPEVVEGWAGAPSVGTPETAGVTPGQDVTGQWSIPVAGGELPEESGEFTATSFTDRWSGSAPDTLPGGAPAPWAAVPQVVGPPEERPPEGRNGSAPGESGPAEPASGGPDGRASDPVADDAAEPPPEAGRGSASADGAVLGALPDAPVGGAASSVADADRAGDRRPTHTSPPAAAVPGPGEGAEGTPAPSPASAASAPSTSYSAPSPAGKPPAEDRPTASAPDASPPATGPADSRPEPVDPDTEGTASEVVLESASSGAAGGHPERPLASYLLRVNGTDRPVTDAWIGESLLYVLRERLGLAGAKDGCSQGECGACNVQVDGRLVASCLVPAVTTAGGDVRTVEGLAADGRPSDVQRALARCGAVQCGFCVPGIAMTVHDLLEGNPRPTAREARQALCGNLCRCSGYRGVLRAVEEVVAERGSAGQGDDGGPMPVEDTGPEGPPGRGSREARIPRQARPGGGGTLPEALGEPGSDRPLGDPAHRREGGLA